MVSVFTKNVKQKREDTLLHDALGVPNVLCYLSHICNGYYKVCIES